LLIDKKIKKQKDEKENLQEAGDVYYVVNSTNYRNPLLRSETWLGHLKRHVRSLVPMEPRGLNGCQVGIKE
jgi:hypothetical protein